jgi:hypothetical protein
MVVPSPSTMRSHDVAREAPGAASRAAIRRCSRSGAKRVVGIQDGQVLAAGAVQQAVEGLVGADIGLGLDQDARIVGSRVLCRGQGPVRGSVVQHQDLVVRAELDQGRTDGLAHEELVVEGRDQHGDRGGAHGAPRMARRLAAM